MPNLVDRERLRKNVGHRSPRNPFHGPNAVNPQFIFLPPLPTVPAGAPGAAPTLPGLTPDTILPYNGHSFALTASVVTGVRVVLVTPRIAYPFILRKCSVNGNHVLTEAVSFRILLAQDNDTTAVADPTGSDVVEFTGDVIGAEDPGLHANLGTSSLELEPWTTIYSANNFLKFKIHNLAGVTRLFALFIDVDELII